MGIVNVTPDSFSDGGRFLAASSAIEQGRRLAAEGADILDIGGESTRPGADEVPVEAELERVIPVIAGLREQTEALLSIDTRKAAVAAAALDAGAHIVNDITGGRDPDMVPLCAERGAPLVLMHMRGTPATMQQHTDYEDVAREVRERLIELGQAARAAGVAEVVLDPGIGFAKTAAQNYRLLATLDELCAAGFPVLVGPSRKSFIGALSGRPADDRLPGTIAACVMAAMKGARILRVHDVDEVRRALRLVEAVSRA